MTERPAFLFIRQRAAAAFSSSEVEMKLNTMNMQYTDTNTYAEKYISKGTNKKTDKITFKNVGRQTE